jgi:hypothetical protein
MKYQLNGMGGSGDGHGLKSSGDLQELKDYVEFDSECPEYPQYIITKGSSRSYSVVSIFRTGENGVRSWSG